MLSNEERDAMWAVGASQLLQQQQAAAREAEIARMKDAQCVFGQRLARLFFPRPAA